MLDEVYLAAGRASTGMIMTNLSPTSHHVVWIFSINADNYVQQKKCSKYNTPVDMTIQTVGQNVFN